MTDKDLPVLSPFGVALLKLASKLRLDRLFAHSPEHMKQLGMARAETKRVESLVLAQAEVEAQLIRSGKSTTADFSRHIGFREDLAVASSRKAEPTIGISPLAIGITRSVIEDRLAEDINVAKAVGYAADWLDGKPGVPPQNEIDDDWLYAWRKGASAVTSQRMQQLWGALLAGELSRPNRYSLRTIEFLRTLSAVDAKSVADLLPYVLNGGLIIVVKALRTEGWPFEKLIDMESLGLLSGVSGALEYEFANAGKHSYSGEIVWPGGSMVIENPDFNASLSLESYSLTSVGKDLLSLTAGTPSEAYLQDIGQLIESKGFTATRVNIQSHSRLKLAV